MSIPQILSDYSLFAESIKALMQFDANVYQLIEEKYGADSIETLKSIRAYHTAIDNAVKGQDFSNWSSITNKYMKYFKYYTTQHYMLRQRLDIPTLNSINSILKAYYKGMYKLY